ncbi:uncharacterized protein LOC134271490, partial [Saccostrea cucullata]|uniref:uncharacterized protein LOC134271490 n=1 Tax=Saccostrea cuccullata TaxID=36930 RepID=UPI002ED44570
MYFIAVDLCIEETPKTWREASESCNLVISNTTLRVGVPITDIPAPTFRSAQVHWIGATGTFTPWFELADDLLGECLMETNEGNKSYPCDSADITQSTWVQRHQNNIYNSSLPRWSPYVRRLIINWRN